MTIPFKDGRVEGTWEIYIDRSEAAHWFNRPHARAVAFKALIEVVCGETTPVLWVPKGSHEN